MPKFLFQGSYSADGAKGLLKDGGTARRDAADKLFSGLGGSIEAMYFAFGGDDVYAIVDLPDQESAAAASMTIGASGALRLRTVTLLTAEQIDAASKISVNYRRPGG